MTAPSHRLVWLAMGALALVTPATATAQVTAAASPASALSPPTPLRINPALLYWQSIGMFTEMTPREQQLLQRYRSGKELTHDEATGLLNAQKTSLHRFLKASSSKAPADWGFTMEDGPFMPLPHLNKMQLLCNLTLLKADSELRAGNFEDGVDTLFVVLRAVRHLGEGDLLVTALAQYTVESQVIALLGRHALSFSEPLRVATLTRWRALPPLHTTAEAVKGERGFVAWVEKQATEVVALMILQNSAVPASATPNGGRTQSPSSTPGSPAPAGGAVSGSHLYSDLTPELLDVWIKEIRTRYDEAETALALPWKTSMPAIQELQSKLKTSNALVRTIFPSLPAARDTQARTETHRAMVEAVLEMGSGLNEITATRFQDAFEGKPLQWRRLSDGGYTLHSEQKVRGREVVLQVPGPPSAP